MAANGFLDFSAASLASVLANFITHPFETLKVRQQLSRKPHYSLPTAAREIIQKEGYKALYKGFDASLLRGIISGGGRLTIYHQLKLILIGEASAGAYDGVYRASIGMVSGVLAACVAAPVDMARTRQQAMTDKSASVFRVLLDSVAEGGVKGLFRGTSAVFARQAVFTGAQLASYDTSKQFVSNQAGVAVDSYQALFLGSVISGIVSTFATAPCEMIKTHMQLQGGNTSFLRCAKHILQSSGPSAFWAGGLSLYLKLAPHTFLVLVLTDKFRELLGLPA